MENDETKQKQTPAEVLDHLEDHCGEKITSKRLRFYILEHMKRQQNELDKLRHVIRAVVDNPRLDVYDPRTHKPHKLRNT